MAKGLQSNKRLLFKNRFVSILQEVYIQDMDTFALRILVANDISGLHEEEEEVENMFQEVRSN